MKKENGKMKTLNLIKIASVLLLGVSLNVNAQGDDEKYMRNTHPFIAQLAHSVKLTGEDVHNMQMLLSQPDLMGSVLQNSELKFAVCVLDLPELANIYEPANNQPVEEWMLDSEYLNPEPGTGIETWMLETDYLNEEARPVESWMLCESWLSDPETECRLETWMFDANYLSM